MFGNLITGAAGLGICKIVANLTSGCDLSPNPMWTNGALCPLCLNLAPCQAPVYCRNL